MHHPTDRIAHTTAFVLPVVEHWLEREYPARETVQVVQHFCCASTLNLNKTKKRAVKLLQQLSLNVHIKHSDLT